MNDQISRQVVLKGISLSCTGQSDVIKAEAALVRYVKKIPSAEPECNLDEWCHDCKEYDKEKNRCPRWNRVIRTALEEAQPERKKGKWIRTRTMTHDGELYCSECEQEHPEQKIIWNFCPNCGARMS